MPYHVYVTISEEDKISIFQMEPESGALEHRSDFEVTGRPAPIAVDPERNFLFVGRRDVKEISSYRIDRESGSLSPIGTVTLESDPCYLATDRKGKFLLSAYYSGGNAAVHSINNDGALNQMPVEWLDTAKGAHSMQTDPSNKFAFVPHIAGGNGPNAIFQFRFDENTGHVSPNSPFKVEPDEELGPRHYCFHPSKNVLYFSNEQGCSVTAYNFDASGGTLSAFQTVSTLPDGFQGKNSCAQIQIAPSGKFLYAPNRGHNSIACFSIDPSSSELTLVDNAPSEAVPRAVGVDPQGKFFFAAGLESGRLASYRIDQNSGKLDPLEVHEVGKAPMWVLITDLKG